jgi:hypothetical protein
VVHDPTPFLAVAAAVIRHRPAAAAGETGKCKFTVRQDEKGEKHLRNAWNELPDESPGCRV